MGTRALVMRHAMSRPQMSIASVAMDCNIQSMNDDLKARFAYYLRAELGRAEGTIRRYLWRLQYLERGATLISHRVCGRGSADC
jgi:hypothetical protein